ncbi:hypothetical protein BT96DRAFT_498432 [Gymnopus androsaceus JB14]|uniref:Uncharacterized protein n=1 Tax=Gymnopus androsaceus JB14 TaxID=1447944 RepID=A0A6A4HZI6_9AGAR|nr:hypothetical protein BT96DRAFT_498432 [Gymnopus androsaceus JB14]
MEQGCLSTIRGCCIIFQRMRNCAFVSSFASLFLHGSPIRPPSLPPLNDGTINVIITLSVDRGLPTNTPISWDLSLPTLLHVVST